MIKVFQSFVCNMCTFYLKGPEMTPLKQEEYKFDKASNTSKWFKINKIKKKVHMEIDTVNQWKIHLMTQSKMSGKRAKNILVCVQMFWMIAMIHQRSMKCLLLIQFFFILQSHRQENSIPSWIKLFCMQGGESLSYNMQLRELTLQTEICCLCSSFFF